MKSNKKLIVIITLVITLAVVLVAGVGFISYQVLNDTNQSSTNGVRENKELSDNSNYITDIYDQNVSSVLSVVNLKEISMGEFFGGTTQEVQQSSGSGFVYKYEDGKYYAITNYHVVDGSDALQVVISIPGSSEPIIEDATLLGGSVTTDIAVITFESNIDITPVTIGNSDNLVVGEPVVAMGSPYGTDFQGTTTSGIISGPTRTVMTEAGVELSYIQTDAAINSGNSGGPLFNSQGEVIGVNSMKIADGSTDNMAFAIPINDVMLVVEKIEQNAQ